MTAITIIFAEKDSRKFKIELTDSARLESGPPTTHTSVALDVSILEPVSHQHQHRLRPRNI